MALLKLSADGKTFLPENYWSLNDAFQGVQVMGGTGSGNIWVGPAKRSPEPSSTPISAASF